MDMGISIIYIRNKREREEGAHSVFFSKSNEYLSHILNNTDLTSSLRFLLLVAVAFCCINSYIVILLTTFLAGYRCLFVLSYHLKMCNRISEVRCGD